MRDCSRGRSFRFRPMISQTPKRLTQCYQAARHAASIPQFPQRCIRPDVHQGFELLEFRTVNLRRAATTSLARLDAAVFPPPLKQSPNPGRTHAETPGNLLPRAFAGITGRHNLFPQLDRVGLHVNPRLSESLHVQASWTGTPAGSFDMRPLPADLSDGNIGVPSRAAPPPCGHPDAQSTRTAPDSNKLVYLRAVPKSRDRDKKLKELVYLPRSASRGDPPARRAGRPAAKTSLGGGEQPCLKARLSRLRLCFIERTTSENRLEVRHGKTSLRRACITRVDRGSQAPSWRSARPGGGVHNRGSSPQSVK